MKSCILACIFTGLTLYGQTITAQIGIPAPCPTVNTQDVLAMDANYIYLGCNDGRIVIFDHQLNQMQVVSAAVNPISSLANSGDQQQYWLYAATLNGPDFTGNYLERFNKTKRNVTGTVIGGLADQKQLAADKDANVRCAKVIGLDVAIAAVGYNPEINPRVSCAADETNIYVSSGVQPARVIRGDQEFAFPDPDAYKANATIVYDHSGLVRAVLPNDQINCSPNLYSDGTILLRTCGSDLVSGFQGRKLLIDKIDGLSGGSEPNFAEAPFASAATTTSVSDTRYIVYGTLSGLVKVLKYDGASPPSEAANANLYSVYNYKPVENAYDADRKLLLNTDLMVQSIAARENIIVVLTRPRWPQSARTSYFADPSQSASPTLTVLTFK